MRASDIKPGRVFADRYRVERPIGEGGFAQIFLATDQTLGRKVALKILHPAGTSSVAPVPEQIERFFKRFEREAKIISRLKAPETVALYEFGRTDDGYAFMALEYVEGSNLYEVVRAEGALSPERVERILRGILRGLREAHAMGVQHRDLKPANVMLYSHLGQRDLVKVVDFGLVKITKDIGVSYSSLTSEGNVVGTPRYMAPEYLTDNIITPQTDLYAVGLVACELLIGRPVVQGDTAMKVMTAHIQPDSEKVPDDIAIRPELRAAIDGLMEKDPRRRFDSADDVLELLETGRFADATQDEVSLAATVESSVAFEVASVDDAGELRVVEVEPDVPEEPVAEPAPEPKPLAELASNELELAKVPEAEDASTSGLPPAVVAVAVLVGLLLGALLWWAL